MLLARMPAPLIRLSRPQIGPPGERLLPHFTKRYRLVVLLGLVSVLALVVIGSIIYLVRANRRREWPFGQSAEPASANGD